MKRAKWYLVLLLVGTLLFVGGCTEEPSPPVPPVVPVTPTGYSDVYIPIGEFQSGHQHIDVVMSTVVGGELTVTLGSNPTTGYMWSEFAAISDETVLQQIAHEFIPPEDLAERPPPAGSPGKEVWTFKALKKGTTTILLEYCRGWESSRTPDATSEGGRGAGLWAVFITANIK